MYCRGSNIQAILKKGTLGDVVYAMHRYLWPYGKPQTT